MYSKNKRSGFKHLDFIILDVILLIVSLIIAYAAYQGELAFFWANRDYIELSCIFVLVDILVLILSHNFASVLKRGYYIEFCKTLYNGLIVLAVTLAFLFAFKESSTYSRIILFSTFLIYTILCYVGRLVYKNICKKYVVPHQSDSMIVVTIEQELDRIKSYIESDAFLGYRIAAVIVTDKTTLNTNSISSKNIPLIPGKGITSEYIRRNYVDEVLIVMPVGNDASSIAESIVDMGMPVHLSLETLDVLPGDISRKLDTIGEINVVSFFQRTFSYSELFLKRVMDIVGSLVGIIFMALILLVVGPIIYVKSPGPILFKQERIGRNGKRFKMYKIRSMVLDAEARKAELQSQNTMSDGMMFKVDFDPRIIGNEILPDGTHKSGIGQFIRKTSLDEFPQFINVLKGDMSLVGTRPPTVDEWEKYEDRHRARMAMRPGITGLWQVSGRSNITDFEEIVKLDKKYISEWNIGSDIKILLQTVVEVFKFTGAK